MTEKLKTLKEFEAKYNCSTVFPCILNNQTALHIFFGLKKEAIKWIKFIRNPPIDFVGFALHDTKKGEIVTIANFAGQSEWIKHFFDISEEDLNET